MRLTRNLYFNLGWVIALVLLAILAVMPPIPVKIDNSLIKIDAFLGGYYLELFGGNLVIDLRDFKKGLDFGGGERFVLGVDLSGLSDAEKNSVLEAVLDIVSKRLDMLGVGERQIRLSWFEGEPQVHVDVLETDGLPAISKSIGETKDLKFKTLAEDREWNEDKFQEYYLDSSVWVESDIVSEDLLGVGVLQSQVGVEDILSPRVQIQFTSEGRRKFSELAKQNIGKPIALFLGEDANPVAMPVVPENFSEGLASDPVVTGNFDVGSVQALDVQIKSGRPKVPIKVIEQGTIEPLLGASNINRAVFGGVIGLLLVFVFLTFMYKAFGVIADIILIIYLLFVLAIMKIIPITVSLPAVIGFTLSFIFLVDAIVLLLGFIKEELGSGKPQGLAIRYGFRRLMKSILSFSLLVVLFVTISLFSKVDVLVGLLQSLFVGILISFFVVNFVMKTLIRFSNFKKYAAD